jgi:GntR family transcriptional regulator / MocR family aminotransferase
MLAFKQTTCEVAMSNRTEALLPIALDKAKRVPLKRQLYLAIRDMIVAGTLPAGTRLPSTRALAHAHGVSRSTVVEVFEQLLADDLTAGTIGSGTYTNAVTAIGKRVSAVTPRALDKNTHFSFRGRRIAGTTLTYGVFRKRIIGAFRNGLPALDLFPRESWARHLAKAARHATPALLDYGDAAGFAPLRKAIAERLAITRSVRCTPEQIFVVEGTQHALDTIAQVLLDPGDEVWIEDPGFPGARLALSAAGAKLRPVPVDDQGMNVEFGVKQWPKPRVIFVSPSHQYPMGVALSMSRRLALLACAKRAGAWIIEDDFENEFEYAGRPLLSLQSLDTADRVIYVGTFTKTMAPSLRIGYVIVPEALVDVFAAARRIGGRSCKALEQSALATFIAEGAFARHVRHMRHVCQERQAVLIEEVERKLAGVATVRKAASGIHLLARLAPEFDDVAVSEAAEAAGIDAAPLTPLSMVPRDAGGLLLGYAVAKPEEIRAGIAALARCLAKLNSGAKTETR